MDMAIHSTTAITTIDHPVTITCGSIASSVGTPSISHDIVIQSIPGDTTAGARDSIHEIHTTIAAPIPRTAPHGHVDTMIDLNIAPSQSESEMDINPPTRRSTLAEQFRECAH